MEIVFLALIIFLAGLCFGSFVNAAVYRIHNNESLNGRSYCDSSKHPLSWQDLVPVVSYLGNRGKCRLCGCKLSILYPMIELVNGILFIVVFLLLYSDPVLMLFGLVFTELLFFFAIYDLKYWELPVNGLVLALIVGVIYVVYLAVVQQSLLVVIEHLIAAVLLGGLITLTYYFSKKQGLGLGDVFLFMFVGLFVGLGMAYWFFMIATISGTVVALPLLFKHGEQRRKVKIQFAPFIAFAGWVSFLFAQLILSFFSSVFQLT